MAPILCRNYNNNPSPICMIFIQSLKHSLHSKKCLPYPCQLLVGLQWHTVSIKYFFFIRTVLCIGLLEVIKINVCNHKPLSDKLNNKANYNRCAG